MYFYSNIFLLINVGKQKISIQFHCVAQSMWLHPNKTFLLLLNTESLNILSFDFSVGCMSWHTDASASFDWKWQMELTYYSDILDLLQNIRHLNCVDPFLLWIISVFLYTSLESTKNETNKFCISVCRGWNSHSLESVLLNT